MRKTLLLEIEYHLVKCRRILLFGIQRSNDTNSRETRLGNLGWGLRSCILQTKKSVLCWPICFVFKLT